MTGLKPIFDDVPEHLKDPAAELAADRKYMSVAQRRQCRNLLRVGNAAKTLERLPAAGETFHVVTRGNWSAFDLIPAILRLAAPVTIRELWLATLSFSKDNTDALRELIDAGQVGRVSFLLSLFFKTHEDDAFQHLHTTLTERGGRALAMRVHAKLILAELSDGQGITVESSANLRSCRNVEQFCVTNDRGLYEFHAGWMNDLFTKAEGRTDAR